MSFFIIDPGNNSVGTSVIPTGTAPSNASVVIPTTLVVQQVDTPNPPGETYTRVTSTGTSYTMDLLQSTVEFVSSTYTTVMLPTAIGNPNKKFIILRSFTGPGILTVYPYSGFELIEDGPSVPLKYDGDTLQIVSDGEGNWRTL